MILLLYRYIIYIPNSYIKLKKERMKISLRKYEHWIKIMLRAAGLVLRTNCKCAIWTFVNILYLQTMAKL